MAEGDQQSSEELAAVLNDLLQRIERLKTLYEQYFMGIERLEPQVARKEVTRAMLMLQQQYIRNTGLRFKFNTMLQKWSSYTTYWNRVLREIENGTYVRHLQKAARHAEQKGRELPSEMKLGKVGAADDTISAVEAKFAAMTAAPASPAAARPSTPSAQPPPLPPGARPPAVPPGASGVVPKTPTPPTGVRSPTPSGGVAISTTPPQGVPRHPTPAAGTATVPGMSEGELRALHQRYQEARRAIGDATPVRYETLVASLAKQVPKVLEQPGVRGVRFDVAVRDGKAVLKAIPTK